MYVAAAMPARSPTTPPPSIMTESLTQNAVYPILPPGGAVGSAYCGIEPGGSEGFPQRAETGEGLGLFPIGHRDRVGAPAGGGQRAGQTVRVGRAGALWGDDRGRARCEAGGVEEGVSVLQQAVADQASVGRARHGDGDREGET